MRNLFGDVRLALRAMRQSPGFHILVLGILALGIAASVSVFSLVDGVVLRPLPYPEAGRLVAITATPTKPPYDSNGSFSYTDFERLQNQARSFQEIAATYRGGFGQMSLIDSSGRERVRGGFVTPNFFAMAGRTPMLGRTFTAEENHRGDHVVLIGAPLATRRFGSPAAALGRQLPIGGKPWTIIGVMPADFRVPFLDAQIWAPVMAHPEWIDKEEPQAQHLSPRWDIMARLRPGVSVRAAQSEIDPIYQRLRHDDPRDYEDRAVVVPLLEHFVGAAGRPLLVLGAAVALLLLIALANAGNLILARATGRQQEYAIRVALGAGTGRLLRQALAELLTLCLLGGACGAALSAPLIRILKTVVPGRVPRLDQVGINLRVLLFAVTVSVLSGVCLGLIAAWRASRRSSDALTSASRGFTTSRETRRLKNTLVAAEFALAMVLLTGTALLVRSFVAVSQVDVGFRPKHILTMYVDAPVPAEKLARFYSETLERVRPLPGVQAAGLTSYVFQVGITRTHALRLVEGRPPEPKEKWGMLEWSEISGDYFQALGVPLLRGRFFDEHDNADAPPVVIVNETLAKRYWPGEDPIGKRLKGMDPRGRNGGKDDEWLTVVGLVRDIRAAGREQQPIAQIYEVQAQRAEQTGLLVLRTAGDPTELAVAARTAIGGVGNGIRVTSIATMPRILEDQQSQRIFQTWLIGVFSAVALGLAALGVFAVMHFSVAARAREIGIRMALGARSGNILALVVADGARLAAVGIFIGALGSAWAGDALSGFLFGVTPGDPISLLGAATLLVGVAMGACCLPARRAARLDPMSALRQD
ncbi:MAG TPA: ABC transporter permease [Bryobacteraceae bacterium]|nr:ABC transporter permease [Bryobacteraceae bacterium]